MNNKEILANAPEGATHYSNESECYYMLDDMYWNEINDYYVTRINSPEYLIRYLADIQRIVELEEEVKRLQPKTMCINCEETEVSNNLCACCGWLQEEGKYEVKL